MVEHNDLYIEELGEEIGGTFRALISAAWRINKTWIEFSDAWFCPDDAVETMNSTSKLFFINYRNGLLTQLVLDLVNITHDSDKDKGAEILSIWRLVLISDALGQDELKELNNIRKKMRGLVKLRNRQLAHWSRDVKTGAVRKSRVDFTQLKDAVSEVTDFLERLHKTLMPNSCPSPIFQNMRQQQMIGFNSIIEVLRSGLEARRKEMMAQSGL